MKAHEVLRSKYVESGISQQEISERCGVNVATIHGYMVGRMLPKPPLLAKLAGVLDMTPEEVTSMLKEHEAEKGKELGERRAMEYMNEINKGKVEQ